MEKSQTTKFWRGRLPHWEIKDASYFVTLRLSGSLPLFLKKELKQSLGNAQNEGWAEKSREYFLKLEAWLDKDHASNYLTNSNVAHMIMMAFQEYERRSIWKVHSYVIMPNHLHWFFTPVNQPMSESILNFKRYTARRANKILNLTGKRFWQAEWFDHWSRSAEENERIISYIRNNPVKAGLVYNPEDWPYVK